jgi:uncharacterized protein HemY
MPTVEDALKEYDLGRTVMGTSVGHYKRAKEILETCLKDYPKTTDTNLATQLLKEIGEKLEKIQV